MENYINNTQLKILEKQATLEELDYQFIKGDSQVIPLILSTRKDINILEDEVKLTVSYKDEMFKEEKK